MAEIPVPVPDDNAYVAALKEMTEHINVRRHLEKAIRERRIIHAQRIEEAAPDEEGE